jgi:hypothetical protein
MKLPFNREQGVRYLIIGGVFLFSLALDWWGLGSLMKQSDDAQKLTNDNKTNKEVSNILGRPGGISAAKKDIVNLETLNSSLGKQEESLLGPWRNSTSEAMGVGKDWSKDGNKWKDLLVNYNDEILKKAGKKGDKKKVVLTPNFYLGLEEFKQRSPGDVQVPLLATQLSVSKRLVDLLFHVKENTKEGYPTSCLLLSLQGPLSKEGEPTEVSKSKQKSDGRNDYPRESYMIEIECSPEVLYAYIHRLVIDDYFFIPINLQLENEKDTFPKRSELVGLFNTPLVNEPNSGETRQNVSSAPTAPLLLVLAGKERLHAKLQIDFVRWGPPFGGQDGGKK